MKYAVSPTRSGRFWGTMFGLVLLTGLVAHPVRGGALIPPRDLGELARVSEAVVLAKAGPSLTLARGGMIYTHTTFAVLDVVSGPVARGGSLVVETIGGVFEGRGWAIGGSPRFGEETVYLLFLNRRAAVWVPRMMAYGLLERVEAADGALVLNHVQEHHDLTLLPRPDGVVPEALGAYYEAPLLEHLRQVTTQQRAWDRTRVEVPAALRPSAHREASKAQTIPEPCVYFTYEGYPLRWNAFDEQRQVAVFAEENGDASVVDDAEFDAVAGGITAWDALPGVNVDYHWAGPAAYTPDCTDGSATPGDVAADQGLVQYNDPCGQMPDLSGCSGVLAYGGSFFEIGPDGRHVHREQEWNTSAVAYVVVNNDVGPCLTADQYRIMITHELGHTFGFDHIPFGTGPSIMNPTCCVEMTEIDRLCALYSYSDGPLPGAPGPITLLEPQDAALDQPTTVDFVWQADTAAAFYHLQVSEDDAFMQRVYEDNALTQPTHRVGPLLDGTAYFWRVRGRNGIGEGPWSDVYRFTTQVPQVPPDSVVLTMPADSAIHQPTTLTLDWEDAERATRYHLQVSADSAFSEIAYDDAALTASQEDVGPLDHLTVYYWRVRARNAAGESPWSAVWRFKTLPPLPGLVAPIAPPQDATGVAPTAELSWEPVALTDAYHLQVATTFEFSQIVFEVDMLTTTYRTQPLEADKKYFWRVRARNAAGAGPWMGRQRFTTGTPPGGVALVAPLDRGMDQPSTIRFEWQDAENTTAYHLQVSTDSSFLQIVFEDERLTQTTQEIGPLVYLTTYFWRVRGIGATGAGDWSAMRRFTVSVGTALAPRGEAPPDRYALHPNYPNPFKERTTLGFDLPEAAPVSLVVFDVLGRAVETLVAGDLPPGRFSVVWEAADRPSGVYLARLQAGPYRQTQQLLLLK